MPQLVILVCLYKLSASTILFTVKIFQVAEKKFRREDASFVYVFFVIL